MAYEILIKFLGYTFGAVCTLMAVYIAALLCCVLLCSAAVDSFACRVRRRSGGKYEQAISNHRAVSIHADTDGMRVGGVRDLPYELEAAVVCSSREPGSSRGAAVAPWKT